MALTDKFLAIDPQELADFLVARRNLLPREVKEKLQKHFGLENGNSEDDFDLKSEIKEQINAVRALRRSAVSANGTVLLEPREVKDALSATTSLLTLLVKIQEDVYNQDRVRLIQRTTIDVLKEVDSELANQFLKLFKQRLGETSN